MPLTRLRCVHMRFIFTIELVIFQKISLILAMREKFPHLREKFLQFKGELVHYWS